MKTKKNVLFTTERRRQLTAEAMENGLTIQQLYSKYETELASFGITTAGALKDMLYQSSLKLAKDLNKVLSMKEQIKEALGAPSIGLTGNEQSAAVNKAAQLQSMLAHFKNQGFDIMNRTSEYNSICSDVNFGRVNVDDILSMLGQ